jgi:hypothetical protein
MTTTTPTRTELDDQLTTARQRLEATREQLGAASLDGAGERAAARKVRDAEGDVTRIEAMIGELERREASATEQEAEETARRDRIALYRWIGEDYLPQLVEVIHKREALERAEQDLRSLTVPRRITNLKHHHSERIVIDGVSTQRLLTEVELDYPLLRGIPAPPRSTERITRDHTAEQCNELAARAKELVEAEERGEGESVTVTGPQWKQEHQARRLAKRAAIRAQEEEAKAKVIREREEAEERKLATRDAARRRELAGNAKARGAVLAKPSGQVEKAGPGKPVRDDDGNEVRGRGSSVPEVMNGIEKQEAGFGDSR